MKQAIPVELSFCEELQELMTAAMMACLDREI